MHALVVLLLLCHAISLAIHPDLYMVSKVSPSLPNMATYTVSLHPPAAFCFDCPDEWAKWKQCFEQFRQASGLLAQSEERQVSTLLYTLEEDSEDVLSSTNISSGGRKNI